MPMPPQFLKKAAEKKMAKGRMPMGKAQEEGADMMKQAISRKLAKRKNK
jgi:hypothetical protein